LTNLYREWKSHRRPHDEWGSVSLSIAVELGSFDLQVVKLPPGLQISMSFIKEGREIAIVKSL